jgi:hypothetical protein
MNEVIEKIGLRLFPEYTRRFLTFRLMTISVTSLGILTLIFRLTAKLPPEMVAVYRVQEQIIKSPPFLISYSFALVCGFWFVFSSRRKAQYYWLRVVVFGMLFAGAIGELLIVLAPLHS